MYYPVVIFSVIMISCSPQLSTLNQRLIDEHHWTNDELTKIQFYLSDPIILFRKAESSQTTINKGKIKYVNGETIEELVFEKGTPGVMLFSPKENRLAISFENNSDSFLMFGPNPKYGNRYLLLGKDWNKNEGTVTYNGLEYQTSSQSAFAGLLINLKNNRNLNKSTRVAEGRKIEQ